MPALKELIKAFEHLAPPTLAESWDKAGLQKGDLAQDVKKILISLNASASVLEEASEKNCELVFCHHPLALDAPTSITGDSEYYRVLKKAFTDDISIYAAHTNLDKAPNGINSVLANFIDLKNIMPLAPDTSFKKLVFFAEPDSSREIIDSLSAAGAGVIGDYTSTSFRGEGKGTFFPGAGAKPATGKVGQLNAVEEERIEMMVHSSVLGSVVSTLLKVHPYEEVAYDIYPLEHVQKSHVGLGCIGALKNKKSAEELSLLFEKEGNATANFVGDYLKKVQNVAILGGSGARYIDIASSKGAELLITADVKYHDAQRAQDMGLKILAISHYGMEKLAMDLISPILSEELKKDGLKVEIINSKAEKDVFFES